MFFTSLSKPLLSPSLTHCTARRISRMVHASLQALDTSPPRHPISAGTSSINRELFRKTLPVVAARIPAAKTGAFLKAGELKKIILDLPKLRSVIPAGQTDERLLLLGSHCKGKRDIPRYSILPQFVRFAEYRQYYKIDDLPEQTIEFLTREGASFTTHDVQLEYDYWTADEILQAILPEELCDGSPTGFAITGHLAHFNLRDEYLPFKNIIGQVVMDKNKKIRTVVNKLDNIHNQFRFFDMELIAGEPDFVVQHHESECRFTFDFREVYWNSRLHTEHERLVQLFNPEDGIIADVFAGVGPFAIPAAKKGCAVLANDLNPNSFKWMKTNVVDNSVTDETRVFCEDGRDFIRAAFKRAFDDPFPPYLGPKSSKRQKKAERKMRLASDHPEDGNTVHSGEISVPSTVPVRNRIAHFVMNLPETAIEFLDALHAVLSQSDRNLSGLYETMPMVHCHCFTRFLDPAEAESDIRKRVEYAMGGKLECEVSLHHVRSVAPNKDMYCISFRLPRAIAFA